MCVSWNAKEKNNSLSDGRPLGRGKGNTPPTSYPPMLGRPSHQPTLLVPHHSQLDAGITTKSLQEASRSARFTESAPAAPPPIRDKITTRSVTPSASIARFRRLGDGFPAYDPSTSSQTASNQACAVSHTKICTRYFQLRPANTIQGIGLHRNSQHNIPPAESTRSPISAPRGRPFS